MKLSFKLEKMSGAGNTFALIDAREGSDFSAWEKTCGKSRAQISALICEDVYGIHTDGALFIEDGSPGYDFNWDFYNSDGSTAEMCGNAARCATRFCMEKLNAGHKEIRFKTGAGLVSARPQGLRLIEVTMPEARVLQEFIGLKSHTDAVEKFTLVNTGVPHLVQKIHTMDDIANLKEMARESRAHKDLGPAGANVTFYVEKSATSIQAVTFERGVEDYTLACGTGAVAAALVHSRKNSVPVVEVRMPGGLLKIEFVPGDARPLMTGEAVFVGTFEYNLEELV